MSHMYDALVALDLRSKKRGEGSADAQQEELVEFPFIVINTATASVSDQRRYSIIHSKRVEDSPPVDAVNIESGGNVRKNGEDGDNNDDGAAHTEVQEEVEDDSAAFIIPKSSGASSSSQSDAISFQDAIRQFNAYIFNEFVQNNKSFCLVTADGRDTIVTLRREAQRHDVKLAAHFLQYIDIRKEFSKLHPSIKLPTNSLAAIAAYLQVPSTMIVGEAGFSNCRVIAEVVESMMKQGHIFTTAEIFSDAVTSSSPAASSLPQQPTSPSKPQAASSSSSAPPFAVSTPSSSGAVASATPDLAAYPDTCFVWMRGLPWQATAPEVISFLEIPPHLLPPDYNGVLTDKNIIMTLDKFGRPRGEAMVFLPTPEAAQAALDRHNGTMLHRYIEVMPSSRSDFIRSRNTFQNPQAYVPAAPASSSAPPHQASHHHPHSVHAPAPIPGAPPAPYIQLLRDWEARGDLHYVKLRGLSFGMTNDDVYSFFDGVPNIRRENIHLVTARDGKCYGDAFAVFERQEDAAEAVKRHRAMLGPRYIEVYPSSRADMLVSCERNWNMPLSSGPSVTSAPPSSSASRGGDHRGDRGDYRDHRDRDRGHQTGPPPLHARGGRGGSPPRHHHQQQQSYSPSGGAGGYPPSSASSSSSRFPPQQQSYPPRGGAPPQQQQYQPQQQQEYYPQRGAVPAPQQYQPQQQYQQYPPAAAAAPAPAPMAAASQFSDFVVRIRNLPFTATEMNVAEFLCSNTGGVITGIAPRGIHMVYNAMNRPTGEAFVEMTSAYYVQQACSRSGSVLAGRAVEVYPSSKYEMVDASGGGGSAPAPAPVAAPAPMPMQQQQPSYMQYPRQQQQHQMPMQQQQMHQIPQQHQYQQMPQYQPMPHQQQSHMDPMMATMQGYDSRGAPQAAAGSAPSAPGRTLRLRGVPFRATNDDILRFFHGYDVNPSSIQFLTEATGRRSGEVLVTFNSQQEAQRAAQERNRAQMDSRYIEIFLHHY